jgi:hypothetical protein
MSGEKRERKETEEKTIKEKKENITVSWLSEG